MKGLINEREPGAPSWYNPETASRAEKKMAAFELLSRGYSAADCERKLKIAHVTALKYRKEWQEQYTQKSIDDPHILNKVIENVHKMLDELEIQYREAWEIANNPNINNKDKIAAVRLAKDISQQKAQILHLTDIKVEIVNQTQRAMETQQKIIAILQDPHLLCDECREGIMARLRELDGNGNKAIEGEVMEGETISEVLVEDAS